MTPPLIFSWFDHTLNTRTNPKRIISIRPHTTSRLNRYTVFPPVPLSILSESLIILFQPQVPQISHTLDKQGYFPSVLHGLKYPDFSVDVTAPFLYSSVTKDFAPDVRTAVVCMAVPVDLTVPLCTAVPDGLTVLHYSSVADGSSARLHKLVGGYSLPVFHLYR